MTQPEADEFEVSLLGPGYGESIVVHLGNGQWLVNDFDKILLGGDLEASSIEEAGWKAICQSTTRPGGKAGVFKVPHHGSVTGHHPEIYQSLAINPISILAPFTNGGVRLPTDNDKKRICQNSRSAFSTALRAARKYIERDRAVMRKLKEMGVKVELVDPVCGQIRLRRKVSELDWRIELSETSGSLCTG